MARDLEVGPDRPSPMRLTPGRTRGVTVAIAIVLAGSGYSGGIAIPPASAATGPDETGQYRGKQGCVDYTVYQPTQKLGFRLREAFYAECQDPSVARPQLEATYVSARGTITVIQGPAGSFGPGRWPTWEAGSAAGSTQVGAVTGRVYAACGTGRKHCRASDITRYGGGIVVTLPGASGLAGTDVMVTAQERSLGKPTVGLDGLVRIAESLQPVAPPSTTSYAFLFTDASGSPAHWDRCTPIRYAINRASLPSPAGQAVATIQEAIRQISAASGFTFVDVGDTSVLPQQSGSWATDQADLFIGYSDPSSLPGLATAAAQTLALTQALPDGRVRIVKAGIAVDRTEQIYRGFHGRGLGPIVLHELGHVLNLGHVDDPEQLMSPVHGSASTNRLQPGDLAGLAQLASLPCFT